MGFKKPLVVEEIVGSETKWKLKESFEYEIGGKGNSGKIIVVPAGFVTDFASIPRIFWPIVQPSGKYRGAAVIHDWLYYKRGLYEPGKPPLSRLESDKVFLQAMKELKVNWFKRFAMYRAVRRFGWISYPKRANP